jgi:hypothetical protein
MISQAGAQLAAALAVGVAIQAVVALAQVLLQRDLGLQILGELHLDPVKSGTSVVAANGTRWLRAYGLSVHPNALGGMTVVGLLFTWAGLICAKGVRRIIWGLVYLAGLTTLLFSFSRGAWLAMGVGALVALGSLAVMAMVGLFDHYPWTVPSAILLWWTMLAFVSEMGREEA